MLMNQSAGMPNEEATPDGLDLADSASREFVDHFIALVAVDYVERMRCTSDPGDLAAWEPSANTTDIGRNLE